MIKIYEVMTFYKGKPLFFNQHLKRFHTSLSKYIQINYKTLVKDSLSIIHHLKVRKDHNLKLSFNIEKEDLQCQLIRSRRPDETAYREGVKTDLYNAYRDNPLIKKENNKFQSKTSDYCLDNNLYDVLLQNSSGYITEGSRSNFLLIDKSGTIISSPEGDALNGITREVIFEICREKKIPVKKINITKDILGSCNSLIITGTSPEILPVKSCGNFNFKVENKILALLIKEFQLKKELDYNLNRGLF